MLRMKGEPRGDTLVYNQTSVLASLTENGALISTVNSFESTHRSNAGPTADDSLNSPKNRAESCGESKVL